MLSFYQTVSQSTNVSPSPLRAPGVIPCSGPGQGQGSPFPTLAHPPPVFQLHKLPAQAGAAGGQVPAGRLGPRGTRGLRCACTLGLCDPAARLAPDRRGNRGPGPGPRGASSPSRPGPHRQDRVCLQRLVQATQQRPLARLLGARLGRVAGVSGVLGAGGVRGMGRGLHGAEGLAAATVATRLELPNSPNPVRAARRGTLNPAICRGPMATAA